MVKIINLRIFFQENITLMLISSGIKLDLKPNVSKSFKEELELELKKYYYKAFRRRGKSLQTLELIQECSEDQFKLFIKQTTNLIKKSLKINDEIILYKLLVELKKIEGCNKKIMKLIISEIINANPTKNLNFKKYKDLFIFEDL
ncbi:MAG: hypothetical protein CMC28_00530 [Flavobacteriaceae bacterium]|nr:hypothetical protein [Flavobacteriaceae bacterium]